MNYFGITFPAPAIVERRRRTRLHHDTETYCEIDLTQVGQVIYTQHPSFELLMAAWTFDDEDEPIRQWAPAEIGEDMPAELEDALLDERIQKFAWNAAFERHVWKRLGIDIPHSQWRDPMVLAFSLSFPGKLEKAGPIVDLPHDKTKDSRGRALIRKFCMPRRPTKTKPWTRADWTTDPTDWKDFLAYNRQDVVSEKAFWRRTWQYDLPPDEWELWCLDQEINEAGIPINMNMVRNALRIYDNAIAVRMRRMVDLTGLDNPNSNQQLLPWLQAQGYRFDDLKKGHVKRVIQDLEPDIDYGVSERLEVLYEVLRLRAEVAKTSIKKYNAMIDVVDENGLFHHAFQFAGAGRTWRWSGRKVQYHNAPRPPPFLEKCQEQVAQDIEFLSPEEFEEKYVQVSPTGRVKSTVMDALATGIRPAVQAPEGFIFVDADLNAIENRVLGYMAQDPKILRVFENDLDPYVDFSTYMLGGTYEQRWHEYKVLENKEPRTLSKPAVLGCGYMLGPGDSYENHKTGEIEATGLLGYAWNMGVTQFTKEQSELAVKVWRETFSAVSDYDTGFWYSIQRAAMRCIRTGEPSECWPVTFDRKGPFMRMILPSGRALHYCRPRIEDCKMPWGDIKPAITYENLDDRNQWIRIQTHPGKLTENADQAISRDLLAHGIKLAKKEGLDVRLHVHDQIVAMVPERQANWGLATLLDCMKEPPPWAPNMPLGAAGTINRYFVKD